MDMRVGVVGLLLGLACSSSVSLLVLLVWSVMVLILYGVGLHLYLLLFEGDLLLHLLCDLFLLGEVLEDLLEDLPVELGSLWLYLLCL